MQLMRDRLAKWGGWPIATKNWDDNKFHWQKLLMHLTRTNGLHLFFSIQVQLDRRNTTKTTVEIDRVSCNKIK